MSTYKQKQRELRSPDAFQKAGHEALPWLAQNQRRLLIWVLVAVAAGAAIALRNYIKQRAELREAEAFSVALAPLVPAPGDVAVKPLKEADVELLASLRAFEAQSSGDTPAAHNAQLLLSYIHLRMGEAEEALKAAEQFLTKAPPEHPLRLFALEAKGYALEQSQQYEQAFAAFGALEAANAQPELKGKGEYHQARMLLLSGKREEALALFEKTAALELPTPSATLAKQRVEALSRPHHADAAPTEPPDEADKKTN